jgi:predicted Zn-dependent protease
MEPTDIPSDDEIKKLRREVDSHPTDLQCRFDLGVALFRQHKYSEAIPELQKAQWNPYTRWSAMRFLAEIYDAKGMSKLASQVRDELSKESGEDSDAGSAPVPAPKQPITPLDSFCAERRPDDDGTA